MASPRRRPGRQGPVLALLTALALAWTGACAMPGGDGPEPSAAGTSSYEPDPGGDEWTPCPLTGMEQRECRGVTVPVGGGSHETLRLALSRLPARDPARRIGALVLAPGGPGLSGLQEAVSAGVDYPRALRDRFDIVGYDRRGTGRSHRVDCGEPRGALDRLGTARSLRLVRDVTAVDAAARDYVEGCRLAYGPLLARLGSRAGATDLERVRRALGEERISLLLHSYATVAGQVYVTRHPERVRAAVFDGVVDPDRPGTSYVLRTLHTREELDDEQVPEPGPRAVPKAVPSDVRAAFDELDPGPPPLALFLGVHCTDFRWPGNVRALLRELDDAHEARWRTRTVARDYAPCVHWPGRGEPLGAVRPGAGERGADGAVDGDYGAADGADLLLINSEDDIRTPAAGAERVAMRFRAPLLTVPGRRHGLVGFGNECAERAAVEHLTARPAADPDANLSC
ncbi:alpha/beta hydrolase [Streptomyces sp. NBC_01808]|uniref:alpha/beta fold hydrolase n=1 Tax=Streptomyces sp. NBC_01808 TaxID=2975947 RepID=UPI002DDA537F|nr:alpha/beta fold hydrolase [Streptomyces sp. NBC_01808]WSA38176.1 alpha/beta hydrolase [Streptomyces sp. NBC_01808]